jgi:hypothetical protein
MVLWVSPVVTAHQTWTVDLETDPCVPWQVYVDGKFAARLPPPGYKSTGNDTFVVDGGMPLKLDTGNIYLCGRADGDPDRHYSGSIAHLQIFDETLKPSQVRF